MALDGIFLYHLKNEVSAFAVGARIEKSTSLQKKNFYSLFVRVKAPKTAFILPGGYGRYLFYRLPAGKSF